MFRAQLTAGDANFDLYNRVKMLDEHVQYNRLKGVYVPDLSRGPATCSRISCSYRSYIRYVSEPIRVGTKSGRVIRGHGDT